MICIYFLLPVYLPKFYVGRLLYSYWLPLRRSVHRSVHYSTILNPFEFLVFFLNRFPRIKSWATHIKPLRGNCFFIISPQREVLKEVTTLNLTYSS